ncbi:MAG: hypothetical protein ABL930_12105 [Pseudobdellovibrio sp.]
MNLEKLTHMGDIEAVSINNVLEYAGASIVLGLILMILAAWTARKISENFTELNGALRAKGVNKTLNPTEPDAPPHVVSFPELILNSSNVLFLCFGMTGMMILVNNNLARAFAIGAAISVVRFRIKLDSQGLGATLFFGVLVGMACGVGQLETAAFITIAYGILQLVVVSIMRKSQ